MPTDSRNNLGDPADPAERKAFLYFPREYGYVYVTRESTRLAMPHLATVLLAAPGHSVAVVRNGKTYRHGAIAAGPGAIEILGSNAPVVRVGFNPLHPCFRTFANSSGPDVVLLDRNVFAAMDGELASLLGGQATVEIAGLLMDKVISLAVSAFCEDVRPDWRQQRITELLRASPDCSLQQLAQALGLSYHRMSHAFKELTGLSLRNFKAWQKLHTVLFLLHHRSSMTSIAHAAGFTDSAHLLRQFQRNYGASVKHYFRNYQTHVFICERLKRMASDIRNDQLCQPKGLRHRDVGTVELQRTLR